MKPRLLLFTSNYAVTGGDNQYWTELLQHPSLAAAFEPHVVLRDGKENRALAERLAPHGVRGHFYDIPLAPLFNAAGRRIAPLSYVNILEAVFGARRFRRIGRVRPDLAWFNLGGVGDTSLFDAGAAECRRAGVPYWLAVHNVPPAVTFPSQSLAEVAERVILGAARCGINSLEGWRDTERALGRSIDKGLLLLTARPHSLFEKAERIARDRPPAVDGPARMLHLGSYVARWKGQHLLLEALGGDAWRHRDWTLTLHGEGPDRWLLQRLIERYGLASRVRLAGRTSDILAAIESSDLFVFPSLSEGKGFALVEALACARPAVGTPIGGIPELVIDGQTGWMSRSTRVEDLAAALERAWADRPRWPQLGANGRERVCPAYDQDVWFPQLVQEMLRDVQ